MALARLRQEAPRLTLGLSLDHWDGVSFDNTALLMADYARAGEIKDVASKGHKDAGGMDVIANLVAMVARRG